MPGRSEGRTGRETQAERVREASRRRREHEKQELRAAILQVAAEVFLEQGYQGFSMRGVAERLGYTVATLYLYFENKDDLLVTLLADAFEQLDRDMVAVAPRMSAADAPIGAASEDTKAAARAVLGALAQAYVTFGLTHAALYTLMFIERPDLLARQARNAQAIASGDGSARNELASVTAASSVQAQSVPGYRALYNAVEVALAAGALRTGVGAPPYDAEAQRYSDALWAQVHGIVALALRLPDYFTAERVREATATVCALWFDGVG